MAENTLISVPTRYTKDEAEFFQLIDFKTIDEIVDEFSIKKIKAMAYCFNIPEKQIEILPVQQLVETFFQPRGKTGVKQAFSIMTIHEHPILMNTKENKEEPLLPLIHHYQILMDQIFKLLKEAGVDSDNLTIWKYTRFHDIGLDHKSNTGHDSRLEEVVKLHTILYQYTFKMILTVPSTSATNTAVTLPSTVWLLLYTLLFRGFGALKQSAISTISTSSSNTRFIKMWNKSLYDELRLVESKSSGIEIVESILLPLFSDVNIFSNEVNCQVIQTFISMLLDKDDIKNKIETEVKISIKILIPEIIKSHYKEDGQGSQHETLVVPWSIDGEQFFIFISHQNYIDEFLPLVLNI